MIWQANDGPQTAALRAEEPEVLFGGARGGGKSEVIAPKALRHVARYGAAASVLILRETYPQLSDLMDRTRPLFLAAGARWQEQKKTWRFPSGARVRFGHTSDGCDPYWGHEYSLIVIDELTRSLADEREYHRLLGSLRSSLGARTQMFATSNPGGRGHAWVRDYFMRSPAPGVRFIASSLADNPHLPASYRAQLERMPEAERRAYLLGDWDAFDGAVFTLRRGSEVFTWAEYRERWGDFKPRHRFRAYDHGYAAPGCCLWIGELDSGRWVVYRELYTVAPDGAGGFVANKGSSTPPRDVARMIALRSEGEDYTASWTGRDMFDEPRQDHAGGVKLATHFQAEGVHFTAWTTGPGSRLAGKQALHQRLAEMPDGWPGLVVIQEECPHLIRTLPALEYSRTRPEQVDDTGEDHAYDALAGAARMRPVTVAPEPKRDGGWRERASIGVYEGEAALWG